MSKPYQESPANTRAIASAQQAWAQLQKLQLVATPENYTLFFAYYSGHDAGLIRAVDLLLASDLESEKLRGGLSALHDRFLNSSTQQVFLSNASLKFDEMMRQIITTIEVSSRQTDSFGNALDKFELGLQPEVSVDQIRYMVAQMALETRAVVEQNSKLQEQLQSSSNQVSSLRTNLETVRKESLTDALTGVGNRKAFTAELDRMTAEAAQRGEPLSLLMIDIDHFKNFNDAHGHLVGDQVLKLVAHTLTENIKGRDLAIRWGGEEFAILLPLTKLEDALRVGNHLRQLVASKKIIRKPQNQDLGAITLSMGAAQYVEGEETGNFVDRADQALYQAKETGRNRIAAAQQPAQVPRQPKQIIQDTATIIVAGDI